MQNTRELLLKQNKISVIEEGAFEDLINIVELDLSGMKINRL